MRAMRDEMVYLASPYTHKDPSVEEWRYRAVLVATAILTARGVNVFSPIVYSHHLARVLPQQLYTHDFWLNFDKKFMDRCEVLSILSLPGWDKSDGVNTEFNYMVNKQRKPFRLCDPKDINLYSMLGMEPSPCAFGLPGGYDA